MSAAALQPELLEEILSYGDTLPRLRKERRWITEDRAAPTRSDFLINASLVCSSWTGIAQRVMATRAVFLVPGLAKFSSVINQAELRGWLSAIVAVEIYFGPGLHDGDEHPELSLSEGLDMAFSRCKKLTKLHLGVMDHRMSCKISMVHLGESARCEPMNYSYRTCY